MIDVAEIRHDPKACDAAAVCAWLGLGDRAQRQAGGLKVLCPSHEERTPSCSVRRAKDGSLSFRCFACDWSADLIGAIQLVRGLDFKGACADLAAFVGRHDYYEPTRPMRVASARAIAPVEPTIAPDLFHQIATSLLDACPLHAQPDVAKYIAHREIHADAVAVGVAALPPPNQQGAIVATLSAQFGTDALSLSGLVDGGSFMHPAHRLMLPWRARDGRISTIQRRIIGGHGEPKYVFPRGVPNFELFGSEFFDDEVAFLGDVPIVATEGAIDALSRRKIARLTGERVIVLGAQSVSTRRPEWSEFLNGRDVRIAFDDDPAGDAGAERFAETCCRGVRSLERERPLLGKDWSETLMKYLRQGEAA